MRVLPGPLLADRTTLRLGGKTMAEIVVRREADMDELAGNLDEWIARLGGEPMVLGAGSNILATDHELGLVLIRLEGGGEPSIAHQNAGCDALLVRVPAALRLPRLLGWCCMRGAKGLEPWAGIPGTVGGAVAMNAGSYGLEMADVLERVLIWTPGLGCVWREAEDLGFGYRWFDSGLDEPVQLVLAIELRLGRDEPGVVRTRMRQWYDRKKQSQPVTMASAGCVFKNPSSGEPAGKLLEQVGLRGYRQGNMAFSEQHANFLVNLGGGTSGDAFALLEMAQERVERRFGLELKTEVRVIT
ncbi:UDP-N-acetylmuramate dehydrogenase [Desulfonatronum thioautotrophicum]|uniref:UDP-N-acetylmuramate dehydrogenase n=1 Tax=Desulfonatronum thioautotrophicum TaxID=617001 RepID=UPI0005EB9870|nr:UDP-N-acetylmuramate dehydrogenase [Desulfonatronum thioautotrophicum]